LSAPWINFETGAIAKTKDAYVCTLLLALAPADVPPPLGDFQATVTERDDVRRLVETINTAVHKVGEKSLAHDVLDATFGAFWPDLEKVFAEPPATSPEPAPTIRSEREMLAEVLDHVRALTRRQGEATRAARLQRLLRSRTSKFLSSPLLNALA